MKAQELPSTWRVYTQDWGFYRRFSGEDEPEAEFDATFEGRVRAEDWEVRNDPEARNPWELWVRLWNVRGEWKTEALARQFAEGLEGDVRVVARNSKDEHVLRQYGVLKLI